MAGPYDHILRDRNRMMNAIRNQQNKHNAPYRTAQSQRDRARWLALKANIQKVDRILKEPDEEPPTPNPNPNGGLHTSIGVVTLQNKYEAKKTTSELLVSASNNLAKMAKQCDAGDLATGMEFFGAVIAVIQLTRLVAGWFGKRKQQKLLALAAELEAKNRAESTSSSS